MIYLVSKQVSLFSENYKIISVKESFDIISKMNNIRGLDTETSGLNPHHKDLLTVQIGNKESQIVIDCTTTDITLYKDILEDKNVTYILANAKFDIQFFFKHNIILSNVWDVMLAEQLLHLGYPRGTYHADLKTLEWKYLGKDMDKTVRGKINKLGLTEEVIIYAANDVVDLPDLQKQLIKALYKEDLLNAIKIENKFVLPLAYMEWCGVKLDIDKWKYKMSKDSEELNKAKDALDNYVATHFANDNRFTSINMQGDLFSGFDTSPKCTINWNSVKQVAPLFEELGIKVKEFDPKTKTSKYSLDAKLLTPQKDKFEILKPYLDYKGAQKLCSTYGTNWLDQIDSVTGRIYTKFNQLGTNTARISSGGKDKFAHIEYVNFLNLPSDALTRSCFVAEKGSKWLSIDYSGQESFLMASISNDKAIIHELMEGSGDLHSLTAYMSYPNLIPRDTPISEIKAKFHHLRQISKGIEFAINYGGDYNTIHKNKGIPLEEAKKIYNNYMSGFSGLAAYQKYCREIVMEKGYILMSPISKYRAHIYDFDFLKDMQLKMQSSEFWEYYNEMKRTNPGCDTVKSVRDYQKKKGECERNSINYRIQHAGAMCFKFSMIYFFKWIVENNLFNKVKITICPYDEINCEAPKDIAELVVKELHKMMVKAGAIFCTKCTLEADESRLLECIKELPNIMNIGDSLVIEDEKVLFNVTTNQRFNFKELKINSKEYFKNGELPTWWIH